MKLQQLYRYTRKALEDYQMIEEGDNIAIGISGGKDSLALLFSYSLMPCKPIFTLSFRYIIPLGMVIFPDI